MDKAKTVIITGASRGIGRAAARLFAENGYNVLINYLSSGEAAESLRGALTSDGLSAAAFRADVSLREQVDLMVDACADMFGGVDILINNAAISQSKLFTDITDSEWDEMLRINLKGVFNCSQSALRYMLREKKGKIINISSIWGVAGASCEVHYSAAKAGVIGFTKALAKELGPSNIQVNCIAPGVVETDMLSSYTEEDLAALRNMTPLLRLGTPEDIAYCALYLASDRADFITGQVISPNGGFVI